MARNFPYNNYPYTDSPYNSFPYTQFPYSDGEEERVRVRKHESVPIPGGLLGSMVIFIWFACWLTYKMLCLLFRILRALFRLLRN